jgi:hypothetical protein
MPDAEFAQTLSNQVSKKAVTKDHKKLVGRAVPLLTRCSK